MINLEHACLYFSLILSAHIYIYTAFFNNKAFVIIGWWCTWMATDIVAHGETRFVSSISSWPITPIYPYLIWLSFTYTKVTHPATQADQVYIPNWVWVTHACIIPKAGWDVNCIHLLCVCMCVDNICCHPRWSIKVSSKAATSARIKRMLFVAQRLHEHACHHLIDHQQAHMGHAWGVK